MKATIAAILAVFALAAPAAAHAGTYVADPPECNCTTAIGGEVFVGYSYAHAWDQWATITAAPGYQAPPPVTSVSVSTTVSGTVEPPAPARSSVARVRRSSWGAPRPAAAPSP